MAADSHLHIVILAGGPGTRLWPLSSPDLPKPFLPIPGPRTLIGETIRLARRLAPLSRISIVASKDHAPLFRKYLPDFPRSQVLFEPQARNTAAAIALGAACALKRDPKAVVCVLPADHVVARPKALLSALSRAAGFCEKEYGIVCVGIKPTAPSSAYGYLLLGRGGRGGVREVRRFLEKPQAAKARNLARRRDVFWNGGMFVFRAEVFVNELEQHLPELHRAVARALRRKNAAACARDLASNYASLPAVSVDYGVMERAKSVFAVPCSCGWSDVGSWPEALLAAGGRIRSPEGSAYLLREGLVRTADGRFLALAGIPEAILVRTKNAVLILTPQVAARAGEFAKAAAKNRA